MQRAIDLSMDSINNNGGPFGAVIVKDNKIIAEEKNRVTSENNPTMHAEIVVIRRACSILATYDLTGCTLYTSCEPCPMYLSVIYWAHIDALYHNNSKEDAAHINFDDQFIYEELDRDKSECQLPMI